MRPKKIFLLTIVVMTLLVQGNNGKHIQKRGVMDNFNDGLRMAGQMFGINTAADVANLVAQAFSKPTTKNPKNPDFFSTIEKGLQNLQTPAQATTTSEDTQQNYQESEESHRNQQRQPDKENSAGGFDLSTTNIVTSLLRMVGFDATKLGALAINALVMIASAIGNSILSSTKPQPTYKRRQPSSEFENANVGPEEEYAPTEHQPRKLREGTPIDWILQNPSKKIKGLLNDAIDNSLAEKITDMIENYETREGRGACLKMFICKSSPFIWGMQRSLKKRIDGESPEEFDETTNDGENQRFFNPDILFKDLPSKDEFREHSEKCEKLFSSHCNTTDLYRNKRH